jgi:hypothetical protein
MKQSEKDRQHISFEGDDDAQTTKDDDETNEPEQPKDGAKWMFDSDEDDDEGDLGTSKD